MGARLDCIFDSNIARRDALGDGPATVMTYEHIESMGFLRFWATEQGVDLAGAGKETATARFGQFRRQKKKGVGVGLETCFRMGEVRSI